MTAPTLTPAQRDALIRRAYKSGRYSCAKLAERYGLSRQRVWQIVRRG